MSPLTSRPACRTLLLTLGSVVASAAVFTAEAHAHGAAMAVTGVLTWTPGGTPGLVRTSRGLAYPVEDGYRFICPITWGGPDTPLMGASGDDVWVAGLRGLSQVSDAGDVTLSPVPTAFSQPRGRAIAWDGEQVVGLTPDGAVMAIAPGEPTEIARLDPPGDSIVIEGPGRVLVAVEDQGVLTVHRVAKDDSGSTWTVSPLLTALFKGSPTLVWLPASGELPAELWLRGATPDGFRLDRLDLSVNGAGRTEPLETTLNPVLTSGDPIFGPVRWQGQRYVIVNGQMNRLGDTGASPMAETPRLSCLFEEPGVGLLVCVISELHRYDPATGLGDVRVSVTELRPPSIEGMDDSDRVHCQTAWTDVAIDSGLPHSLMHPAEWQAPTAEGVDFDVAVGADVAPAAQGASTSGCGVRAPGTPHLLLEWQAGLLLFGLRWWRIKRRERVGAASAD